MIKVLKKKLKTYYKIIIIRIFSYIYLKPLIKRKGYKDRSVEETKINIDNNYYKKDLFVKNIAFYLIR